MKLSTSTSLYSGLFLLTALSILFPEMSLAGTGGAELQGVYDKTIQIAQGYGGKSIAAVAFLLSMVAAVRGNLMAVGSAFGVGVIAGVGPTMVTSGVTALI